MRAYVITTGVVFGLITLAHLLRIIMEGRHLATNPPYILLTIVSASLCVWALYVLRRPGPNRSFPESKTHPAKDVR